LKQHQDKDEKSRLQEWAQSKGLGIPTYVIVSTSGPDHDKTFEVEVQINGDVVGRGSGSSKRAASMVAAQRAMESLNVEI
jgi:ribonuclease-3